jgi:septum formation protein
LLLAQLGVPHETVDVEVDERWDGREDPGRYACRLALAKSTAGGAALETGLGTGPVLGADTAVVLDGIVLGKPETPEEALAMLARLSGRSHEVLTAVALWRPAGPLGPVLSCSRVSFRPLSDEDRLAYVASGEPYGKAGGYAIQGLAAAFIERLEGSYSGVMGLPLYETAALLDEFGRRLE